MASFKKIVQYILIVLLLAALSNPIFFPAYAYLDLMIIRWIQYLSGAAYVGLLFFQLCILPKGSLQSAMAAERYRRLLNFSFVLLLISTLSSLPLQAAIEAGPFWQKGWNASSLKSVLNTLFGQAWIIQFGILFFLSIIPRLMKNKITVRWISLGLSICLMAVKVVTGHVFLAPNHLLAAMMDFLHLFSMSIWIGGLTAMVTLLPLRKHNAGKIFFWGIIHLFFPWGAAAIFVLAVTGVYGSMLYIPSVSALINTVYGRVLFGKIILFIMMSVFSFMPFMKGKIRKGVNLWAAFITGLAVLVLAVLLTILQPC